MSTLNLCEQYFGTRDVYALLELSKEAPEKDIKKAYYKLSLQVHPDRVGEEEKAIATEKFKVLGRVYQVLTDKDKRALYDEQGIIDDDEGDVETKLTSWLELWRKIFKPLTTEEITNYEKSYVGSELERGDIKKAYLGGKGCINYMMNHVPFLRVQDEPRLHQIVGEMIAANEVPEYTSFTKESSQKRKRRHKKCERESQEAEELKKKLTAERNASSSSGSAGSLEQQIMERQRSRESNYNSLMEKLLEKYGDDDDSDSVLYMGKKRTPAKAKKTPAKLKKTPAKAKAKKEATRRVENGKVKKRKN